MVKSSSYIPERGDMVWLDFNPQLGHEQKGRRPALVISYKSYNEKVGLALFCPITSKIKGYPFEVKVEGKKIHGSVLSDQVKSLDWKLRNVEFIEEIAKGLLLEVIARVKTLME